MKETLPPRLFCHTADLVLLTGKSDRTCQRLMQQIKIVFGLEKHQRVTIHQVSNYLGIPLDQLLPYIKAFH